MLDAAAALTAAPILAAGPLEGTGGHLSHPRHLQALGRISAQEVSERLSTAAIFASSTLYEPFGLGVLDAAQAGCALVLSDIPTFRELWDGAAIFADPRRPEAFATAFDALLADQAQARRLGALAQARSQRFTAKAMSDGVLEVYRGLGFAASSPATREAVA